MIISGFQPLSLLDYPGVIASIIFTQGCPFRCVYCHNPELIPTQPLDQKNTFSEAAILDRLHKRKHIVEGVCITGGEPTVHHDLPLFIKKIKDLGLLVKLDTNGVHPRMIESLIDAHLIDFIAMDLKHTWDRYPDVIGIQQKNIVDNCRETFNIIQASSLPHEFRTTVYSGVHSAEDLEAIAAQLKGDERYALQDIRYEKTFKTDLEKTPKLDLEAIAAKIRINQPTLRLEVRA